ncbi:aldose 1-epimerase family protein [Pseudonocardia humida]|uniref:Aldose 1-epimerase family protein n=1 Tax=Pseudonocardia humida TaxID=2800819 RepID=A0ABT0ZX38_9PSEU|nr:aldose 1-epimerase family protein [Pseudonocardia humida]MCO1655235.1 aldose 1-epimerase family protein [Pseudonocardia humida]
MLPTGQQLEISAGPARAVLTQVGAGLRAFSSGGRPYVETFAEDRRPPRGAGTILVPWPNRVAKGRWTWRGEPQQLALTEPAGGNAIHGLLRHTVYEIRERTEGSITLGAIVTVQPGWPVPLDTDIRYAVGEDGLTVTHTVRNIGGAPVPFGVGAHPYLRAGDSETDDSVLTLSAGTSLPLDGGLPAGPTVPVSGDLDFRAGRPLRGRELDHAFGDCTPTDGLVRHRLAGPAGEVEMWAEPVFGWVQVFTPDDHPDRGRAVAVEPMTCPPDALNTGVGLIELAAGEEWTGSWGIRPLS